MATAKLHRPPSATVILELTEDEARELAGVLVWVGDTYEIFSAISRTGVLTDGRKFAHPVYDNARAAFWAFLKNKENLS